MEESAILVADYPNSSIDSCPPLADSKGLLHSYSSGVKDATSRQAFEGVDGSFKLLSLEPYACIGNRTVNVDPIDFRTMINEVGLPHYLLTARLIWR